MNDGHLVGWSLFAVAVIIMLVIDLLAHKDDSGDSKKSAIGWSVAWIAVGCGFAGYVGYSMGPLAAQEYFAAYLLEKSLSLDNLFVFLLIFKSLKIPRNHQRKALTWGVLGAVVFRAIFIFVGAKALEQWAFMEYFFGAILFYAAWHAMREDPAEASDSRVIHWLSRKLPVSTDHPESPHFFQRVSGKLTATPLLVAVCGLELTDVMFAIDSVPAAFSVTRDTYLVYTSNIFAILGLRSLYIVLAQTISNLDYLHYGLAGVLAFAGFKMVSGHWVTIPPLLSVLIIALCIGVAVVASLWRRRKQAR